MVRARLGWNTVKLNMRKKIKRYRAIFFYYFNKRVFDSYLNALKDRPQKVTAKFLTKLILQNSKIDKQNIKIFPQLKEHMRDFSDDEDFFIKALIILLIIFFLWVLLVFVYFFFI